MAAVAAITAKLEMDNRNFERNAKQSERTLKGVEQSGSKASTMFGGMGKMALAAGAAFATAKVGKFLIDATGKASDYAESVNAIQVASGDAATGIIRMGENAAQSMGLSKTAVNEAGVAFSAFGEKIAGADGDAGAVFEDYIQRATDFASVMNLETADALQKFQSGLAGETEALRRFGVDVSATTVETYAFANGIGVAGEKLTEAQKIQARYGVLMQQTEKFAGDFANTSDGMANSQKRLSAEWENAQVELGEGLMPIMTALLQVLIPVVKGFAELSKVFSGVLAPASAAERTMERVNFQLLEMDKRIEDGADPVQTVADLLGHLARNYDLTAESMKAVQDASGLTTAEMVRATGIVKSNREAYGMLNDTMNVTEENAAAIGAQTGKTADEWREAMRAANGLDSALSRLYYSELAVDSANDELGEGAAEAAWKIRQEEDAAKGAEAALINLAAAHKGLVDPVFAAISATQAYIATLKQVDEDGERTNEEIVELMEAFVNMQAATGALDSTQIEAFLDTATGAMGLTRSEAIKLLEQWGLLDGTEIDFWLRGHYLMDDFPTNIPVGVDPFVPAPPPSTIPSSTPTINGGVREHSGGIIGGVSGTDEVLRILQKGEGVIDRDTMRNGIGGGGGASVVVNVAGSVTSERDLVTAVRDGLTQLERRNGTSGL